MKKLYITHKDKVEKQKVAMTRKHYFVQFGNGKDTRICHKCGTVRKSNRSNGTTNTTYEKNGETFTLCPECNETDYSKC